MKVRVNFTWDSYVDIEADSEDAALLAFSEMSCEDIAKVMKDCLEDTHTEILED